MKKFMLCVLVAYVAVDYIQSKVKLKLVEQVYEINKVKWYMEGVNDTLYIMVSPKEGEKK